MACHDYHMGHCTLPKGKCPYSHVGTSYGICPNKNYCTTPHKFVLCPLIKSGGCPIGDKCSYMHEEPKKQSEEVPLVEESKESSEAIDNNPSMSNSTEDTLKNQQ